MKTIVDYINESKAYNYLGFWFKVDGEEEPIHIMCYTTDTRSGFCHHASITDDNGNEVTTRMSYYNRTWEKYRFQTVMNSLIDKKGLKLSKEVKAQLKQKIKDGDYEK